MKKKDKIPTGVEIRCHLLHARSVVFASFFCLELSRNRGTIQNACENDTVCT